MCKLFCVLDVENQNDVEKFIKKAVPYVTRDDDDGLGIMRLGENGVFIQRWLDVPRKLVTADNIESPYKDLLRLESNESGIPSQRLDAVAIHGRLATCGISLDNVHPFYLEGTALMHNGIMSNTKPTDNIISSCDSEALLHRYIDKGVKDRAENLTEAMSDLTGYYATIVFNDNGVVDIWRDNQASLVLAYVPGIGNVIATNAELIYKTAKACKKKVSFCYPVLAFTHLRWERNKPPVIMTFDKPVVAEALVPKTESYKAQFEKEDHWFNEKYDAEDWHRQKIQEQKLRVGI